MVYNAIPRLTPRTLSTVLLLLLLASALPGCVQQSLARWKPNSHYAYPNSNVTELGPVKAKLTTGIGFLFFIPDLATAAMDRQIYQAALDQQAGANLIIDYILVNEMRQVGPLFTWTTIEIDGTAARMEVGEQQLR